MGGFHVALLAPGRWDVRDSLPDGSYYLVPKGDHHPLRPGVFHQWTVERKDSGGQVRFACSCGAVGGCKHVQAVKSSISTRGHHDI
jgi:hypothetical protein